MNGPGLNTLLAFQAGRNDRAQRMAQQGDARTRQQAGGLNALLLEGNTDKARAYAAQTGNPEMMAQAREAIGQMDEAARQRAREAATAFGQVGASLQQLPYEQRRMALADPGVQQRLQAYGIQADQLAGFDPTDANIAAIMAPIAEMSDLLDRTAPVTLGQNETLVNPVTGDQTIGQAGADARGIEREELAETVRSNRADEGIAAGRLNLDSQKFAHEQAAGPDRGEQFTQERQLRQEFNGITSDYREMQQSLARLESAARLETAQGDLALVVAFTKLLDPGSVAREGEVNLSQSSASVVQSAANILNQLENGNTILPAEVREGFLAAARELAGTYDASYLRRQSEYGQIAGDFGLERRRVVGQEQAPPLSLEALGRDGPQIDFSQKSDEELYRILGGG